MRISDWSSDVCSSDLRRLDRELAARAVEALHLRTGEGCRAAAFEVQDVRRAMGDDLLARATVDVDGELVAHGAGRQEDRGLLVQQLRRHLAEAVHTGIVAALLVADRCLGPGAAPDRKGVG